MAWTSASLDAQRLEHRADGSTRVGSLDRARVAAVLALCRLLGDAEHGSDL